MARDKYKALSEEEKNKKRDRESNLKEYGKNLYIFWRRQEKKEEKEYKKNNMLKKLKEKIS